MPNWLLILIAHLHLSDMTRRGSKNGYQNDMCVEEIALHVQNMIIILGLKGQHNWGGPDLYDRLMSTRIFTLTMSKILR